MKKYIVLGLFLAVIISVPSFAHAQATSTITVFAPNGNDVWRLGETHDILWFDTGSPGTYNVYLFNSYFGQVVGEHNLIGQTTGSVFHWNVGRMADGQTITSSTNSHIAVVKLATPSYYGLSSYFTIPPLPSVAVLVPNGGEVGLVGVGETVPVIASTTNAMSFNANLNLSWVRYASATPGSPIVDSGLIYSFSAPVSDGGHSTFWSIPSNMVPANNYKVKAELCSWTTPPTCVSDLSDNFFTISNASITITSPNGGERWRTNTTRQITWTSANVPANSNIELDWAHFPAASSPYVDHDAVGLITNSATNTGSYNWFIPPNLATSTPYYRIVISATLSNQSDWPQAFVSDSSDGTFSISGISLAPTNPLPEPAVTAMLNSRSSSGNWAALAGLDLISVLRRILANIASRQR